MYVCDELSNTYISHEGTGVYCQQGARLCIGRTACGWWGEACTSVHDVAND